MAGDIILSNGTTITAAELAEIAGEVKRLIAKEAKEPSQYEEVQSLANLTTLPALLQNGLEFKLVRVAVQLLNPVLQKTDLAIQWKRGDTGQFVDLITIAEIQAPAKAATDAANAAATKANTAAASADTATGKANTATTNANAATAAANGAAQSANTAAASANNAADRVDASITDISTQKQAALEAATSANQAAASANSAASKANTATTAANASAVSANEAASNADTATGKANAAATSATSAASTANQAASYATEIADHQPIIGEDGYWYRWDSANDVYIKTDDYAKGGADYPVFGLDDETMNVTVSSEISNDRYAVNEEGILVVLF